MTTNTRKKMLSEDKLNMIQSPLAVFPSNIKQISQNLLRKVSFHDGKDERIINRVVA
jgi:hypothetical protein